MEPASGSPAADVRPGGRHRLQLVAVAQQNPEWYEAARQTPGTTLYGAPSLVELGLAAPPPVYAPYPTHSAALPETHGAPTAAATPTEPEEDPVVTALQQALSTYAGPTATALHRPGYFGVS